MASKDLLSGLDHREVISPAAITATAAGAIIDTQGFESIVFLVDVGVITAADADDLMTFTVAESDDSGMSGGANITGDDITFGDSWDGLLNATGEGSETYVIGVLSALRYLQLTATETTTSGGFNGIFGVVAILGHPLSAPATT